MSAEMNPSPKAKVLAEGIAKAEGFAVPGSLPARTHNPGDLEIGDIGYGTVNGKTVFPDDQTGMAWLYGETTLMLASRLARHHSRVYNLDETFLQVAVSYTGADNAAEWAMVVSGHCSMTPQNTLQDFLNA